MWHGRRVGASRTLQQLSEELGLSLSSEKCQLYRSPHSRDHGTVEIDGVEVSLDDHIRVMGYKLWAGVGIKEALKPILARDWSKFW